MKAQLEEIQKADNSELDIGLGRIAKTSEDMMFTAPTEEGEKPKGRPGARVFGSMQADFDELGSDTSLDLNDGKTAGRRPGVMAIPQQRNITETVGL